MTSLYIWKKLIIVQSCIWFALIIKSCVGEGRGGKGYGVISPPPPPPPSGWECSKKFRLNRVKYFEDSNKFLNILFSISRFYVCYFPFAQQLPSYSKVAKCRIFKMFSFLGLQTFIVNHASPMTFWSAHAHQTLACTCASHFDLRMRISFWPAHAHLILACACASSFDLRMRISFWPAHALIILACACACPFCLRMRMSF